MEVSPDPFAEPGEGESLALQGASVSVARTRERACLSEVRRRGETKSDRSTDPVERSQAQEAGS
jgi:hypothetical protein